MNTNACNKCGREMDSYFSECLVQCACGNKYLYKKGAPIAQLEEQIRPKDQVGGSSPLGSKSKEKVMRVETHYTEDGEAIIEIPEEAINALGWNCGDEVKIEIVDGQIIVTRESNEV